MAKWGIKANASEWWGGRSVASWSIRRLTVPWVHLKHAFISVQERRSWLITPGGRVVFPRPATRVCLAKGTIPGAWKQVFSRPSTPDWSLVWCDVDSSSSRQEESFWCKYTPSLIFLFYSHRTWSTKSYCKTTHSYTIVWFLNISASRRLCEQYSQ